MKDRYTRLATQKKVDTAIARLASELLHDFPESPLFVVLLRGGMPFATRLMQALVMLDADYHPELDYLSITTYGKDHEPTVPEIRSHLSPDTMIEGRPVVVLDDVLDTGVTSETVIRVLKRCGATSVKLAMLAVKDVPERRIQADYVGLTMPNTWLVGMGLDDAEAGTEAYRWLPEIWEIKH